MMSGWSRMASTASLSPFTTCSTPSGSPASCISAASISGTDGSRSDGLRMKALPQAIAGHIFHIGIIAGKLNGVMPATTPSGWRIEYMSMPGPAASVNSPFSRCGAPMQNSATSRPRCTSPLASGMVLPCSRDSASASLSMSRLSSVTNFIITRARRCGLVAPHATCARAALATASSSSAAEARATRACTSPVAGLKTSALRPERPGTRLPSMKCPSSSIAAFLPSDPSSGTLSPKAGQCSGKFVVPVLRIRPPGGGGAAVAGPSARLRGAGDVRGDSRTAVITLLACRRRPEAETVPPRAG